MARGVATMTVPDKYREHVLADTSNPCPAFRSIPADVLTKIYDGIDFGDLTPTCSGRWLSGSGGHRIHDNMLWCNNEAVWWHPDDCHSYCDEHCPEHDKELYRKLWNSHSYGLIPTND